MSGLSNSKFIIGADIGGSHITAAVIDLNSKKIIETTRTRLSLDCNGTSAHILGTWAKALILAKEAFGQPVDMVAVAMPGPFDYKKGISYIKGLHKYESIYGLDIKGYLANELHIKPEHIIFRNDAEAFLHGEIVAGAGLGYEKVIGITLGTGTGSARSSSFVTEDVNRGSLKFQDTIVDDYLSTRWFVKRYLELTGKTIANVKELTLVMDTDADAQKVFKEFTDNLVLFLKDFINDEEPELVIIGGNIAKASKFFMPSLEFQLAGYFEYIEIKIAELGEDSAIMGAAAAFENIQQQSI